MAISKNIIEGLKTAFNYDSRFIIEIGDDKSYFKLKLTRLPGNPNVHFEYSDGGYVGLHLESATGDLKPYLCNLRASVIEELKERVGKDGIVYYDKNGSLYGHYYLKNCSTQKPQTIKKYFDKLIEIFEPIILRNMKLDTQLKELLLSNHNLILTGAPGTGKTYLAKQIAKAMGAETEFVQFHPSYDYTDFVEGLRPKSDANGNIGFERRDGVFKAFCKEALRSLPKEGEDELKKAYDRLVEDIKSGKVKEITLKKGKKDEVEIKEKDEELSTIAFIVDGSERTHEVKYTDIQKLSQKYKTISDLNGIPNIFDEVKAEASYIWAVLYLLYQQYYDQKFVFIIDEINRGDVSKILGELFFSIDPGYRGEKGKVKTQYHNLLENSGDVFEDGFYVPENVYIIGTMNDIDRSVESMDFAMRRRFAWKEITAEDQMDMLDDLHNVKEKAKNRLLNLNNAIEKIEGLSAAYHIGPAYFLKLEKYKGENEGAWNSLWENHIEGVLREYLRGNDGVDDHIKDLKNAYNNEQPPKKEK